VATESCVKETDLKALQCQASKFSVRKGEVMRGKNIQRMN